MSKLEELINELCPDGVEYKTIGEVCDILDNLRRPVTKKDRSAGIYPYYGANGIQDYVSNFIFDGTFLLVGEDGSVINKDNSPVLTWAVGKIWVNNHAHILREKPGNLLRFFYHSLQTIDVSPLVRGVPPKINQMNLRNIKIPVPPLSVQLEIVRILDNFTRLTARLTAELTAELTARKKQYKYYRDLLFEFGDDVPRVKLLDITDISRGVRVVKKQLIPDGKYPVYQNCLTAMGYYDKHNCDADTTYVISAGAAGEIGFSDKDFWAADDCLIFSNLNGVINKYIYYFLTTKQDFIRSNVRRASIPRLSRRVIENLQIPFVPLEEQERIVAILDRFDTLCNDITSGLPAEIEARRKQYEYYRDKLLTFKEGKA